MEDSESDRENFMPPHAGRRFDCTSGLDGRGHIDKGKGVCIDVAAPNPSMRPSGGGTGRITPDPSDGENADPVPLELDDEESDFWRADEPGQQAGPRGQKRRTDYGALGRGDTELEGRSRVQEDRSEDPAQTKRPRLADESRSLERLRHPLSPGQELDSWFPAPASRPTTAPPPAAPAPAPEPEKLRPAIYRAFIKQLYKAPGEKMMRIIKCLEKYEHPNTTKAEASAAMRLAQRLMADHNVAEAEVLSHMPLEDQARRAAVSVVSVQRVVEIGKQIQLNPFVGLLSRAMSIFFDCKSYSSDCPTEREFTFYGIAENTALAAEAFKNIHNLIAELERSKKGSEIRDYPTGVADGLIVGAEAARKGELELAERAEAERLAEKEEEERIHRQRELDRLRPLGDESEQEPEAEPASTVPATTGSSGPCIVDLTKDTSDSGFESSRVSRKSHESDVDMESGSNVETEDDILNLPPPPPAAAHEETPWESSGQLIAFRERAAFVADEYLKINGIKLTTARPPAPIRNLAAWRQGMKDSKKINVREHARS